MFLLLSFSILMSHSVPFNYHSCVCSIGQTSLLYMLIFSIIDQISYIFFLLIFDGNIRRSNSVPSLTTLDVFQQNTMSTVYILQADIFHTLPPTFLSYIPGLRNQVLSLWGHHWSIRGCQLVGCPSSFIIWRTIWNSVGTGIICI